MIYLRREYAEAFEKRILKPILDKTLKWGEVKPLKLRNSGFTYHICIYHHSHNRDNATSPQDISTIRNLVHFSSSEGDARIKVVVRYVLHTFKLTIRFMTL